MNDINAATTSPQNALQISKKRVEARIQELNQLKEKGLLDENEFSERKRKILEGL